MPVYLLVTTIFGSALLLPALLSQVALWQRKEYRLDRMRAFALSPEGSIYYHPPLLVAYALVGIGWIFFFLELELPAELCGWGALICLGFYHIRRIITRGLYRPKFTAKAVAVLVVIMLEAIWYAFATFIPTVLFALQWATFHFFLVFMCLLAVAIVNLPFGLKKSQIIRKATLLRAKYKDLEVMGITGSFGKTSTKYFLHHILGGHSLNVITTKHNHNSYIGVAQDMLTQLKPKTNTYIVEMAAYKRGEIAEIARMVKPSLGIITAIGNQHLELFGSKANILSAKWELAQALPKTGTLIINDDDNFLPSAAKDFKGSVLRYSVQHKADVYANHIMVEPTNLFFRLHVGQDNHTVRVPLLSTGLLGSALAAVAGATALQVPFSHILERLETIRPVARTMELKYGLKTCTVIDDSYSGGESAALNAIAHLARFPQSDKRIVFVPIIELGHDGYFAHEKIGRALAQSGANIFVYGQEYREVLERCFVKQANAIRWYTNPVRLVEHVTSGLSAESVLLLEGRVPALLRRVLYSGQLNK